MTMPTPPSVPEIEALRDAVQTYDEWPVAGYPDEVLGLLNAARAVVAVYDAQVAMYASALHHAVIAAQTSAAQRAAMMNTFGPEQLEALMGQGVTITEDYDDSTMTKGDEGGDHDRGDRDRTRPVG